jgi:hypothetical protein
MQHARLKWLLPLFLVLPLVAVPAAASAERIRVTLTGFEEVPVVSTVSEGKLRASIARDEQSIEWRLSYSGLQGTVQQAHIHVAQLSVNGAIVLWLCGTATNPGPPGTQTCPQSGTISGTATAADVVAPVGNTQQLTAGDLAEVIRAIRAGAAYANVHTSLSPGGEIRGQLRGGRQYDDDDD